MTLPALKFRASPNFNRRGGARVDQIIIHDMEGSYSGSIAWFEQARSQVSAHFCVREDGGEVTQMVHLSDRAWHACAANSRSVGIEMAGYATKGYAPELLAATAALTAELCHFLQIPVRHARGGVGAGIESHWGLGQAGGGHSDPSTDIGWIDRFVSMVQVEYDKGYDLHYFDGADAACTACRLAPPVERASAPATPLDSDASVGPSDAKLGTLKLDTVADIQRALNVLGAAPALNIDGRTGRLTEAAVRAFQAAHPPLLVDGVAGPLTKSTIVEALAARP